MDLNSAFENTFCLQNSNFAKKRDKSKRKKCWFCRFGFSLCCHSEGAKRPKNLCHYFWILRFLAKAQYDNVSKYSVTLSMTKRVLSMTRQIGMAKFRGFCFVFCFCGKVCFEFIVCHARKACLWWMIFHTLLKIYANFAFLIKFLRIFSLNLDLSLSAE